MWVFLFHHKRIEAEQKKSCSSKKHVVIIASHFTYERTFFSSSSGCETTSFQCIHTIFFILFLEEKVLTFSSLLSMMFFVLVFYFRASLDVETNNNLRWKRMKFEIVVKIAFFVAFIFIVWDGYCVIVFNVVLVDLWRSFSELKRRHKREKLIFWNEKRTEKLLKWQ